MLNPPKLNPTSEEFDKSKPEDVETTIDWGSATSIENINKTSDSSTLVNNTDYKVDNNKLIFLSDYLKDQDDGEIEFLVDFNVGNANFNITIYPKGYSTGNRIWAADSNLSLEYTWDAKSFTGFYYDLDAGLSSESMTIELLGSDNRRVEDGDLEYTTEPIMVDFEHDDFGEYQAVGFMADRYFAGFTDDNTTFVNNDISMMADGQLSKVLIDSDDRRSVFTGSSLVLDEGYSINIVELDVSGDSLFLTLTKDGQEVDSDILSSDDFYVYEKDIGSTDDVPLIAVHIGNIFRGTETNAVFIDGIFQISEDYVSIEEGEQFGKLEITSISPTSIEMRNDGRFTLSRGSTIDIMGDVKIEVADSGTLRFAPFVDITEPGKHEIRGTVAENEGLEWTPLNFEGFYYDIDEGLMTESLTLGYSGRLIDSGNLTYETNPVEVNFEHSDFGKYQVIGFMAEKYFAGFTRADTEFVDDDISMIADGQLSKVLLDNDDRRTLYTGSSLVLEEGYTLNMQQIDIDGNQVWVSLRKDGSEVDDAILEAGSTYVYEKDLGSAEDVPIIAVQLQSVFRGTEVNALFIEGIFQISEDYLLIEEGDTFGEMEVDTISPTSIVMTNDDNINLRTGRTIDLMGDIKFKVADDSANVRYYPFVEREIAGDSLDLDIPSTISQDETITIKVTSRGASVNDATVKFDGQEIGTTDREGELRHNPERAGTFEVRAEKSGYIPATGNIEVIDPDDEGRRMSIEVSPDEIFEGQSIDVRIVSAIGAEPMEDVEVFYDGSSRGTTDEDGRVSSWTVTEPGIHRITATKEGYLDEEKTIEVIALEAEFDYSNLVISPEEVREGRDVTITADVENIGTDAGEYNIELRIDGNVTDSKTVYLEVDEQTTIEFVHTAGEPGNYTVEIGDLEGTFEVTEGLSIVWYVAGVIIVAGGAAAAYMFTAGGWTVEMVKARLAELIETIRSKR
ncbi:S-layer protein [Methanosalsum natronophilum]|uniref:S-layer protein n=1 Tax=Methanosalsum natronophilum TaxID=768733 RepID=A0A3R7VWJ7_9EURY|nr:MAG: S-layer protein [Methanosalsum natronophilum]